MELSQLKGLGNIRLAKLNNAGIFSVEDLVNYLPTKYYDFSQPGYFEEDGITKVILATCVDMPKNVHTKFINYCSAKMEDQLGRSFVAVWYNQPFMANNLCPGVQYYLFGKNSPKKRKTFVVSLCKQQDKLTSPFLAVYKKIDGFGGQPLAALIEQALHVYQPQSLLPQSLHNKYNLQPLGEAYRAVHQPASSEQFVIAKARLDVEKLLPLAAKNKFSKVYGSSMRANEYGNIQQLLNQFKALLKFTLTADQGAVIADIMADLASRHTMNRLLEGEVGSGKTMVAFFCLWLAAKCGYQAAMVAPTEILAQQHYNNITKLLSGTGLRVVHLSGSLSAAQKRELGRQIQLGMADIVVGTHAVISNGVTFKNLSIAVIDEQHRFGVAQRAKLSSKGQAIDVLVLSATPIPRSVALAIYGNLSLSVISSCPFAKKIQTNIVTAAKQPDMWKFILGKVQTGARAFVVCPRIDDDDEDGENTNISATAMHKHLCNLFGKANVGLLHGKMSKDATDSIMSDFASGKFSVLVSTTIVEVGVDIPEAEIMVIASPERFGLATLHQLRGRVGRAGTQSYCFCLPGDVSPKTAERLKFFRDHSSGFDIAEYDYASRGAGDIWGTAQHGVNVTSSINMQNYPLAQKIVADESLPQEALDKMLAVAETNYAKLCNDIVLN